jgi:hypothetical protein
VYLLDQKMPLYFSISHVLSRLRETEGHLVNVR